MPLDSSESPEVDVMLQLALYGSSLWFSGRVLRALHMNPALAWVAVMLVLGPHGWDVVPYTEASESAGGVPLLSSLGQLGVTIHVFDKGLHIHFNRVRMVDRITLVTAILCSVLPVGIGVGVAYMLGFEGNEAFAIAAAMGPTSVSAAVGLLAEDNLLKSATGSLLLASAFINDAISLLGLGVVCALGTEDLNAMDVLLPILVWGGFMVFGIYFARSLPQRYLPKLLARMPEHAVASHQPQDEAHLSIMIATLALLMWTGEELSTHLLGAFVAGTMFAEVPRSGLVWRRQFKRISKWLNRLFFSASVGLLLDEASFWDGTIVGKGLLLALCAGVVPKLLSVAPLSQHRWLVGLSMVSRGPLAFVVAQRAVVEVDIMSDEGFAMTVWSLLFCALFAPVATRLLLRRSFEREISEASGIRMFSLSIQGHHHTGILHEVCDCLHELGLDVVTANIDTDGDVDVELFTVKTRHGDLSEAQVDELRESIMEAVNDPEAQIILKPLDIEDSDGLHGGDSWVEVRLMGGHHPAILHELYEVLDKFELEVVKAKMEEHSHGVDADIFYAKGNGDTPFDDDRRKQVRQLLHNVFKKHNLNGEVMIKLVSAAAVSSLEHVKSPMLTRRSFLDPSFGVDILEVRVDTSHDPHLLEDVCTALSNMQLDVITAEMDQSSGDRDTGVFFAKDNAMLQRSMELRKSAMDPSKWADALAQRQESIQEVLNRLVQKHQAEGSVTVSQLRDKPASAQRENAISAGAAPAPARARTTSAPPTMDEEKSQGAAVELRELRPYVVAPVMESVDEAHSDGDSDSSEEVLEVTAEDVLDDFEVVEARHRASSDPKNLAKQVEAALGPASPPTPTIAEVPSEEDVLAALVPAPAPTLAAAAMRPRAYSDGEVHERNRAAESSESEGEESSEEES